VQAPDGVTIEIVCRDLSLDAVPVDVRTWRCGVDSGFVGWPQPQAGAMVSSGSLHAQTAYPSRPVRLVVPFTPGGVVDLMGRTVAPRMSEVLGQPVVVENRPGAGATLGADFVTKSPPDGHTILLGTIVTHATAPFLNAACPYDPLRAFAPVGFHGFNANWLLVSPSMPIRTFGEFIDHVRRHPGKLNYGTPSIGSSSRLSAELLRASNSGWTTSTFTTRAARRTPGSDRRPPVAASCSTTSVRRSPWSRGASCAPSRSPCVHTHGDGAGCADDLGVRRQRLRSDRLGGGVRAIGRPSEVVTETQRRV
jgi:hypothetical protein